MPQSQVKLVRQAPNIQILLSHNIISGHCNLITKILSDLKKRITVIPRSATHLFQLRSYIPTSENMSNMNVSWTHLTDVFVLQMIRSSLNPICTPINFCLAFLQQLSDQAVLFWLLIFLQGGRSHKKKCDKFLCWGFKNGWSKKKFDLRKKKVWIRA